MSKCEGSGALVLSGPGLSGKTFCGHCQSMQLVVNISNPYRPTRIADHDARCGRESSDA